MPTLKRSLCVLLLVHPAIAASIICPTGFKAVEACLPILKKPSPPPSPTPSSKPPIPSPSSTPEVMYIPMDMIEAFDMHNTYRKRHQASPLRWNATVANAAAKWVSTCSFSHDPDRTYGENLYWTTDKTISAKDAVKDATRLWYQEVDYYNWSQPGWSPSTGHFTCQVWKDVQSIGCAVKNCPSNTMVACKYYPVCNVLGRFSQNVLQKSGH